MLACAVFPLIWIGGLVTTYEAGMAVPDWPTTYGYNPLSYPLSWWLGGPWELFIEHGHRLLGIVAGLAAMVLVAVLHGCERRRWVRGLGWVVLGAIASQGVLGGLRVLLDERLLAAVHGAAGPAVFALCVAVAAVTSRVWRHAPQIRSPRGTTLHSIAILTTALVYLQLLLGVGLRHLNLMLSPRAFQGVALCHAGLAIVLTAHTVLLVVKVMRTTRRRELVVPSLLLAGLIGGQVVLGLATWVFNYGWPSPLSQAPWAADHLTQAASGGQAFITTAHVAAGSLILVVSLWLALRACRLVRGGGVATLTAVKAGVGLAG